MLAVWLLSGCPHTPPVAATAAAEAPGTPAAAPGPEGPPEAETSGEASERTLTEPLLVDRAFVIPGQEWLEWMIYTDREPIVDGGGRRWYDRLQIRVRLDDRELGELELDGKYDPAARTGTLRSVSWATLGDRRFLRLTVDEHRGGVAESHDDLYTYSEARTWKVGEFGGLAALEAIGSDWHRIRARLPRSEQRFRFEGGRFVPWTGVFAEDSPDAYGSEGCGQWECCIEGDRLASAIELSEAVDLPERIEVPERAKIERADFFWVFDLSSGETEMLSWDDCQHFFSDPDAPIDDSRWKKGILLDLVEEGYASVLFDDSWMQISQDCIGIPNVADSTTWVRLRFEGGIEGFLPLDDLRVESDDPELDEEGRPVCVFGERSLY